MLVIDEAAQAVEAETVVALQLRPKEALVLVGDPQQLSAVVNSAQAVRAGFGRSMMHRLIKDAGAPYSMLTVQYRMHDTLARFPSRTRYGDRLVSHPSVAQHRLTDLPGVVADPLRPGPLVLVDGVPQDDDVTATHALAAHLLPAGERPQQGYIYI